MNSLAEPGTRVRYLQLDGRISPDEWEVLESPDRNHAVLLMQVQQPCRRERVLDRRLLPTEIKASAIDYNNKSLALCPYCGGMASIVADGTAINCPEHGDFSIQWLGVEPVAQTKTKTKTKAKPTKTVARTKKVTSQSVPIDFPKLRALGELWTKSHIPFDHPNVTVKAHVLLVRHGDHARKFCMNSYSGSLGRKQKELDLHKFSSPKHGFAVPDLEKERARLQKEGYILEK